jgi:hypothetical protein
VRRLYNATLLIFRSSDPEGESIEGSHVTAGNGNGIISLANIREDAADEL